MSVFNDNFQMMAQISHVVGESLLSLPRVILKKASVIKSAALVARGVRDMGEYWEIK